jgi:hypothetical protein
MENFKDLKVWVKAHDLTLAIYQETRGFPKEEIYGLTSQIRRASASIGANIAEGCGREIRPRDESLYSDRTRFSERTGVSSVARQGPPFPKPKRRRLRGVGGESLRNPTDVGLFIATLEEWGFSEKLGAGS